MWGPYAGAVTDRTILHVDMDAFFASVEQRDARELRGKPVLVGGGGKRGVVAAASYEARTFGCRSAQPMSQALRRCPEAIIVPPRFEAYSAASRQIFAVFREVTPQVEPLSIDEAFLDVSGSQRLHGDGVTIARFLRRRIREETALTASVGVAPNKFLAKLASDLEKPDGLVVVRPEQILDLLAPLSVRAIFGVGPAAEKRLNRYGIRKIEDLRNFGRERLVASLGAHGERLYELAHGRDERPVQRDGKAKSIGQECTFGEDLSPARDVRAVLDRHVEAVGHRLRRQSLLARAVQVKIRFGDFETISRSKTLERATNETDVLLATARALFDAWAASSFRPVRLIGMTAAQLTEGDGQLQLFERPERAKGQQLDQALDAIRGRFGLGAIHRASAAAADDRRQDGLNRPEADDSLPEDRRNR